ncbi:MAG: DUF4266 domain-containing protein [Rhizomicrobium sp.]|nr:DUF4266 domain-containing protein [Rhizomicrobium sp.]
MNNPISKMAARLLAGALIVVACSGCGTVGPQPWEKDLMAQKKMQVDAYALEFAAIDHIYFSKEASSGGRGFAGGGCGCN